MDWIIVVHNKEFIDFFRRNGIRGCPFQKIVRLQHLLSRHEEAIFYLERYPLTFP